LRSLEDEQADLILLDVMMPGMNGFETCKRLKKNVNTVDIPVIFMTALSSIEDKVTGFKAGGVDYITKPFNKAEVLARLQTHLNLRKQKQKLDRTLNELRMQSDTLEQQVQERTMALENSNSQMQLQKQEILEKILLLKSYWIIINYTRKIMKRWWQANLNNWFIPILNCCSRIYG